MLRNKLATLAGRLQQQADVRGRNPEFPSYESVITEAFGLLSQFYKQLSEPLYQPKKLRADAVPYASLFVDNFTGIKDDLEIVFAEFENLESLILANFNYCVSELNKLQHKLKRVSSKTGDYVLLANSPIGDAVYISDSFNDLSRVAFASPLLNTTQCEINQTEGIVTLPIQRAAQVPIQITEVPVINSNSNGTHGNNFEVGAISRTNISDILDNNPDTWFEYERVVNEEDEVGLTLDFTINLGEVRVVNFIRINPNNFGAQTQINIVNIDTSVDGKDFVSVKDDIPIVGFTTQDEENVFTLAPSTSKFAGQGLYTFTPREAKYVHITLRQTTPYSIRVASGGTKLRYAIGLRDVEIAALPYLPDGELISALYEFNDEVRKVVLLSNQNPDPATTSQLCSIEHFISADNGQSWTEIRPKVSAGQPNVNQAITEIIDFNGVSENTVVTTSPVTSLRYKAVLKRNTDAFTEDNADLVQLTEWVTELHTPPTTTPLAVTLQRSPIEQSITVIDPQFGSRGYAGIDYYIGTGTGTKKLIQLPFRPLKRDFAKSSSGGKWHLDQTDPQKIYVNGELWSRGALTSTNKNYKLNFSDGTLEFGDGSNGAAVPNGAVITMRLTEERLFPTRGEGHRAELLYPTTTDTKQLEIDIVEPDRYETVVLAKGATRFQLRKYITNGTTPVFSDGSVFTTKRTFSDGSTELTGGAGDYSIDYENGVIYSYSRTSQSVDTTCTYKFTPRTTLTSEQWSFVDNPSGVTNTVSIKDAVFKTFEADTLTVPNSVTYFNLEHLAPVKGTVVFAGNTSGVFDREVEFIDGRSELAGAIKAVEQLAAITVSTPQVVTIAFRLPVIDDTSFAVTFSDTSIFTTEVGGTPSAAGQYRVLRSSGTTGQIQVYIAESVADPGKVTYYYRDPQAQLTGRYSINYQTGEVFLHDRTRAGITVDYEYTDYRARYTVARQVPAADWTFDAVTRKITFNDREILQNIRTPQGAASTGFSSRYYQVLYKYVKATRSNVTALEPFFSPTLKDYALRVITKSRLV